MATLKISDLSVGDWVEYEGLDYPITFVGYGEGGDGSLVNLIRPDLSCFICEISAIRPIPITAEILEKNGFKRLSSHWNIYKDNDDYIEIWKNRDKWYLSVNSVEHTLCDLHWVHQIQHLMRVWGFDKEINLINL